MIDSVLTRYFLESDGSSTTYPKEKIDFNRKREVPTERSFGHCIVTWELKNYGRALWQNNLEIETPEFSIKGPSSQVTKWKLKILSEFNYAGLVEGLNVHLDCKDKTGFYLSEQKCDIESYKSKHVENDKEKPEFSNLVEEEDSPKLSIKNLTLHLERANSDDGPSDIWVDLKTYSLDINGEKYCLTHDRRFFKKKFGYGLNIGTIYDFEKDFEYNSGVFTIILHMVVKDLDPDIELEDETDLDLQALSEDLQYVFQQRKFCDAELKVDGKSVMVHKAILCSHSNFFEDSFNRAESEIIELPDIGKYYEVLFFLRHLYSYDLEDIIGEPSISVYDSALLMNLSDLVAHYIPEEHKICTDIDIKKFTFTWIVENFNSIDMNCISSPMYCKNLDEAWQIHLYPRGTDGESEYVAISVEFIEDDLSKWFIQCAIVKDNETPYHWKTLHKSEKSERVVEDEIFIKREDLLKLLNNDSFRVGLKVRSCSGYKNNIVTKECKPVLYSKKKAFEKMKENMLTLRRNNKYTDVVFKIGTTEIKAHRFILSARSHVLLDMIDEKNSINVSNISPETLELVLDYMYSATFSITDVETIIDIYKTAVEFAIPRLQDKCSRVLQNSVTMDKASSLLILANENNDRYLKSVALEFISLNERMFKNYIFENMTLKTRLLWFGTTEEGQENSNGLTLESTVKKINVHKYNEDCSVNYSLEVSLESSNEHNMNEQISSEMAKTVKMTTIPLDEYKLVTEKLKEPHTNGGTSSPQTLEEMSYEINLRHKQLMKQDLSLKKRFGSEPNLYRNEERKVAEQVLKEKEINVQIQCQDGSVKSTKSYSSPKKQEIKENLSPTSDTNTLEILSKEKNAKEIAPVLKVCMDILDKSAKDIQLEHSDEPGFKELESNVNKLQSDSVFTEALKETIEVNVSLSESRENKLQEASVTD